MQRCRLILFHQRISTRPASLLLWNFIKDLPQVGSVLGDTNQFSTAAQGNQGLGSINLRGLGPQRTLVLFNGRRTFTAPGAVGGGFGDTNAVPLFALDRIEILKDGAAATYGSDAIAGVANFVTKKGFEGVEIKTDYEFVNGSDDNYTASILFGQTFGDVNIMAGFGWQHRSELPTTETRLFFPALCCESCCLVRSGDARYLYRRWRRWRSADRTGRCIATR